MKKAAAALIGLVSLALITGLLAVRYGQEPKATESTQVVKKSRTHKARQPGSQEARLVDLARQRTAESREDLLELYAAWAGKEEFANDRRAIVNLIIENEDALTAIALIMAAVAKDPIPLDDDELLSTVARDLTVVWADETLVRQGRDMMRLAEDAKAQALVAESLSWRVSSPPSGFANVEPQRGELASDLIQTYLHSEDQALRERLLENVGMVAGEDVAEVLADPDNAGNSKLARRLEQSLDDSSKVLLAQ
jgi:hypothetical protein